MIPQSEKQFTRNLWHKFLSQRIYYLSHRNGLSGTCGTTLSINWSILGGDVAQRVGRRVRRDADAGSTPGAERVSSPTDNYQCSLSYGLHTAPVSNGRLSHLWAR